MNSKKTITTPEEFAARMQKAYDECCNEDGDIDDEEYVHRAMDYEMCQLLIEMGYEEGVKIFRATPKWYA